MKGDLSAMDLGETFTLRDLPGCLSEYREYWRSGSRPIQLIHQNKVLGAIVPIHMAENVPCEQLIQLPLDLIPAWLLDESVCERWLQGNGADLIELADYSGKVAILVHPSLMPWLPLLGSSIELKKQQWERYLNL